MEENPGLSLPSWKRRLKDAGHLALTFARNPVAGMRELPDWDWPFLLTCQAIAAAVAGVGAGIVAGRFSQVITGLLFVPISNALMTAVIAGFFYYTFTFIFHKPASYHRVYTHLVFAQLPALIMFLVSPVLPPLMLFGPAAAAFLLLVGFQYNLGVERKPTFRLLVGLYLIFVVFWIFNSFNQKRQIEAYRDRATPESLDILEKELQDK